jgi:hypothetical protein
VAGVSVNVWNAKRRFLEREVLYFLATELDESLQQFSL